MLVSTDGVGPTEPRIVQVRRSTCFPTDLPTLSLRHFCDRTGTNKLNSQVKSGEVKETWAQVQDTGSRAADSEALSAEATGKALFQSFVYIHCKAQGVFPWDS